MLRKLQLILFLSAVSFSLFSQPRVQVNPGLMRELIKNPGSEKTISLLVKGDVSIIESLTGKVNGIYKYSVNDIASVSIPLNQVNKFLNTTGIKRVEGCYGEGRLMDDMTFVNANITAVHQGYAPLTQGYDGDGTVMAFIDDGIDFHHPDFINADGSSRIKFLWDQTMSTGGVTPQPYNYGQEWDSAAIDAGLCTHVEPAYFFGHGSNVSGIGAGNGRAVNNFYGVAPACDIISVAVDMGENFLNSMVDATKYAFDKANLLGKPCVINASVGIYSGSHDGTDLAALAIDALIAQESSRSFVCAGGNAGNIPFHLGYESQTDSSFTWLNYNSALQSVFYEWWIDKEEATNFNFAIGADATSPYTFLGRTKYYNLLNSFNLSSGVDSTKDTLWNGSTRLGTITLYAFEYDSAIACDVVIRPDATNYYWRFITGGFGRFDLWSSAAATGTSDMITAGLPSSLLFPDILRYKLPDINQTIVSSFSCSDKVITVANFVNRTEYIDYAGDLIISNAGDTTGALAATSSFGPTRDGRIKPDVSAPGNRTLATSALWEVSALIVVQPYKVALGGMHNVNGGTSMASPVVAGIAALYLQKNPSAGFKEVKDAIVMSTYEDSFTGDSLPDNKWGYGKADAFAAMTINIQYGCTDPFSVNFDPDATVNDGSCIPIVFGCMDPDAINFDSTANMDNESCIYSTGIFSGNDANEFITCFPNPSHGETKFYFSNDHNESGNILITDLSGKIISSIHVSGAQQVATYRHNLQAGLYFYHLERGGRQSPSKKLSAF